MQSRSSDVGGKQTEKLEADDVDSCDQRESDIDNFLINLRQKTKVGDGSIWGNIIADSLLTYTIGPLTFLFHPIFYTTTEQYLHFSCIHFQTFGLQPRFPLYIVLSS